MLRPGKVDAVHIAAPNRRRAGSAVPVGASIARSWMPHPVEDGRSPAVGSDAPAGLREPSPNPKRRVASRSIAAGHTPPRAVDHTIGTQLRTTPSKGGAPLAVPLTARRRATVLK